MHFCCTGTVFAAQALYSCFAGTAFFSFSQLSHFSDRAHSAAIAPFCCAGTARACISAAQALHWLHRHSICYVSATQALHLLHRQRICICCTGTVYAAQALCSAAQALYLLHRHCICYTGTVLPLHEHCICFTGTAFLLHRHCISGGRALRLLHRRCVVLMDRH